MGKSQGWVSPTKLEALFIEDCFGRLLKALPDFGTIIGYTVIFLFGTPEVISYNTCAVQRTLPGPGALLPRLTWDIRLSSTCI